MKSLSKHLILFSSLTAIGSLLLVASGPGGVDGNLLWNSPIDSIGHSPLYHNFRVIEDIDSVRATLTVNPEISSLRQFTVFGVWFPSGIAASGDFMSVNDAEGMAVTLDGGGAESGSLRASKMWPLGEGAVITRLRRAAPRYHSFWLPSKGASVRIGDFLPSGSGFRGGVGDIALYGRVLSPIDCMRVESVLALRYGITLDHSYYLGEHLVLDNQGTDYCHRISAIGNLPEMGFVQSWSYSLCNRGEDPFVSSGSYRSDYLSGVAPSLPVIFGSSLSEKIPQGSWMILADNGGAYSLVGLDDAPGASYSERIWEISGSVPAVVDSLHMPEAENMDIIDYKRDGSLLAVQRDPNTSCSLMFPSVTTSFISKYKHRDMTVTLIDSKGRERNIFEIDSDTVYNHNNGERVGLPTDDVLISTDTFCGKIILRINGESSSELVASATPTDRLKLVSNSYSGDPLVLSSLRYSAPGYHGIDLDFPVTKAMPINGNTALVKVGESYEYPPAEESILGYADEIREGRALFRGYALTPERFAFMQLDSLPGEVEVMPNDDTYDYDLVVRVKAGEPPYLFSVMGEDSVAEQYLVQEPEMTFNYVMPGRYCVTVNDRVGDLIAKAGSGFMSLTQSCDSGEPSSMFWLGRPTSGGYCCGVAKEGEQTVSYGFLITKDKVRKIRNGLLANYLRAEPEDLLGVAVSGSSVTFFYGKYRETLTIPSGARFRYAIESGGEGVLLKSAVFSPGLIRESSPQQITIPDCSREFRVMMDLGPEQSETIQTLYSTRSVPSFRSSEKELYVGTENALNIVSTGEFDFIAEIEGDKARFAGGDFVVFDSSGRMIMKMPYVQSQLAFSVQVHGVYLAKIISTEGKELTAKFKTTL